MNDRFKLLIFDWDGTLFDSIPWIVHCLQQAAEDCQLPIPSEIGARSVIGLSLDLAMSTLFPAQSASEIDALVKAYGQYYKTRPATPDGLFAGVSEMLETLKDCGYRLGIATGKQHRYLPEILQMTGTTRWFDAIRGADQTLSKPDPRMLQDIMGSVGVGPEHTLMVGDSVHDLRMAANAQVDAVAVSCGANRADELLAFNPIACLAQTRELLTILT